MRTTLHLLPLLLCFFSSHFLIAQTDTEFWFVAPEVASSHGDTPILLGLSTVGEAATVTVSLPADTTFIPVTYQLGPTEAITPSLTGFLNAFENRPANVVLAKGIHITSTAPINAYYHVNHNNNLDIFTLKGRQALGLEFYIPSQSDYRNVHGEHAFDIVATQDNTTIEITPTKSIVGHLANQTFTIILNRGETFSCRAQDGRAFSHLQGSHVISDKPIAITNSDDSVVNDPQSGWDLIGDQLVPVKLLGTEYIAVRGEAATERVYITAVEDETVITIDGLPGNQTTLNKGESHLYRLRNHASYIESSKPIYVWHMSGFTKEAGAALLPPISCTGLQEINFVRPFSQDVAIILLTKAGNEDGFLLNGSNNIFPSSFSPVAGNPDWVAANIPAPSSFVSSSNQISNTKGVFHMGMILHTGRGSAYGYFSNYTGLTLGEAKQFCEGETLDLDAGPGKDQYLWSTGDTTQQITIDTGGIYWVKVDFDICELRDTIEVEAIAVDASLGNDTTICEYDSITVNVNYPGASYLWDDMSEAPTRVLSDAGTYWVQVSKNGCVDEDSLLLSEIVMPNLDLGPDTMLCKGESITLDAFDPESSYLWQDGSTNSDYTLSDPALYWVEREFRNCLQRDSVNVGRRFLNKVSGIDTVLCLGDSLFIDETQEGVSYHWQDGSTLPTRRIGSRGLYILNASNRCEAVEKSWAVNIQDCDCFLFVPNVFSPNGDGIHDKFVPQIDCNIFSYNLQVYDRWGRQVFVSASIDNQWEGYYGNQPAKEGVYYWVLTYEGTEKREKRTEKGYLTLLR